MLTGNSRIQLQQTRIFFDTTARRQNRLPGDNPDVDFNGLNRMGDERTGTVSASIPASRPIIGSASRRRRQPFTRWYANWSELRTQGRRLARFLGSTHAVTDGTLTRRQPDLIRVTINNSQHRGVAGGRS